MVDVTLMSMCFLDTDEYRLMDKRKRTGDIFQNLKFGNMLPGGKCLECYLLLCHKAIKTNLLW